MKRRHGNRGRRRTVDLADRRDSAGFGIDGGGRARPGDSDLHAADFDPSRWGAASQTCSGALNGRSRRPGPPWLWRSPQSSAWFRRAGQPLSVAAWTSIALGMVTLARPLGSAIRQRRISSRTACSSCSGRRRPSGSPSRAWSPIGKVRSASARRTPPRGGARRSSAWWSSPPRSASRSCSTSIEPVPIVVSSAWYGLTLLAAVLLLAALACWIDSRWRLYAAALGVEYLVFLWSIGIFARLVRRTAESAARLTASVGTC